MSFRKVSVGLLAVLVTAVFGVASASAYTVSPEGPFKAVGHTAFFDFYGPNGTGEVQERIACSAEVLEGFVNAPGATPQISAQPSFYGCESAKTASHPNGLGPVTVKQSLGSVFNFSMTPTLATQSGLNLQITRTNYPACTFNLVGGSNFPSYGRNAAGEIQLFWNYSYIQYLHVANSVTPTEHCPQLYKNGTSVGFSTEPFGIVTHALTVK